MMTSFDRQDFKDYKANEELKQRLMDSKVVEELFTISDASRFLKVNHSVAQGIVKRMAADGLEVVRSRNKSQSTYRRVGRPPTAIYSVEKTHE